MGVKEDAAITKLDKLLKDGDAVIAMLRDWRAAEDESDLSAIQDRVLRLQQQQDGLNALAGVSVTVRLGEPIESNGG